MKNIVLVLLIVLSCKGYATIYQIGLTKVYKSPNALYLANVVKDGDTIKIDAETYLGAQALAVWNQNNLTIIGVNGRPHMKADGMAIGDKGIWILSGNNIIVENIEFSNTTVQDKNGSGIRFEGIGLTVRYCYFHDNDNGILTSNPYKGNILIEYSEFNHNGFGDGYSHNLYVGHVNKLTFRYNYSHHASIGHNLKSRANENYILYNRIMDEESGNSSRLIDLPNGGFSLIIGNTLMQSKNAENPNLIGYGLEGLSNTSPHNLYVINNTLVNKKSESSFFIDINKETSQSNIVNNIFVGNGLVTNINTAVLSNNLIESGIDKLNFIEVKKNNYQIKENSPAIDYGKKMYPINDINLIPNYSYFHPLKKEKRIINNKIDAGAFEY